MPYTADRVKETSTTTGTGTFSLGGTSTGYQTFVAAVGTGAVVHYCATNRSATEWEVGIGTVTDASPDTLSRTTILASSNSGNAVTFTAGTKDIFLVRPAARPAPLSGGLEVNATGSSGTPNALSALESGTIFTNEGATAKVYHSLPTAAAGLVYTFVVQDTDGIRVVAATGDTIRINTSVSATAGYCEATAAGATVTLYAINATEWIATSSLGTWTVT